MSSSPAASLGQLAVLCRLITEVEHAKLRRLVQARARGKRPTSLARLLIKSGFGSRTVRRLLRLGVDLQAVRCDGCGRAIGQAELPERREAPCPGCGALVLGFAAFKKRGEAPQPRTLWDSAGSSDAEHTLVADGVRLPSFPAIDAATPAGSSSDGDGDEGQSTVAFSGVLGLPAELDDTTLPFDDVLALPAAGRGPRSEEETIIAWKALVSERPLGPKAPVRLINPLPPRPTKRLATEGEGEAPEQRLGDWVILRELGEGGVGKVHLARHATTGKRAAVKVLKPDVVRDPEYVERFKREAQAAFRIRHENVVALIEAGRDPKSGQQFIAYEFLDGGSLLDVLAARGRLEEREALKLVRGISLALGVAESQKIVHRDVKPENILLTSDGVAKLADLGLIKEVDRTTRLTSVGIVVGTPCYMAPEQALGEDEIDVRADLYALGLVLWQALSGTVPFEDEEELPALELMTKHIEEDLPDIRVERPGVSDATAQVIKWMTARDKDERYPNPQTLVRDVDLVLGGQLPLGPRAVVPTSTSGSGLRRGADLPPEPARGAGSGSGSGSGSRRRRPPSPAPASADPLAVTQDAPPPDDGPVELRAAERPPRPAAFMLLIALLVVTPVTCLAAAAVLWIKFGDRLR